MSDLAQRFRQAVAYELDQRENEWAGFKDDGVKMDAALDIIVAVALKFFGSSAPTCTCDRDAMRMKYHAIGCPAWTEPVSVGES